MKTMSKILKKEFDYNPVLIGEAIENDWKHDVWKIHINGESFDYKTGAGHRKGKRQYGMPDKQVPQKPGIDDVLYCIVSDASCSTETLRDWCDMLGYDTDSRNALSIYEACQDMVHVCRALGINIEEASEAFSDY